MKAMTAIGHLIAYEHRPGIGQTIVFANSLGSNQSIWDEVIGALPNGYGIVTYDIRGHGLSGASADFTIENLADDAAALIEALGLGDVIFCGVSIGGMIGQVLTSKRPDLVNRAILCNTSHKIGTDERWNDRIALIDKAGVENIAKTIIDNWFGAAYLAENKERLLLHQNMVGRTDDTGYVMACKAIRDADLANFAKTINVPILCIGGDEDKSVLGEHVEGLAALIPNSQVEIWSGLGHLPCLEMPEKLAATIEAFDQQKMPAYERGMKVRRSVLGVEHVNRAETNKTHFDNAFQLLITEGAWGTVWHSPGLSGRERSLLTLALLAAQGNFDEIPMHVRATQRTGASERDIAEAFQHVAIYAGVPRANHALKLAKEELAKIETSEDAN